LTVNVTKRKAGVNDSRNVRGLAAARELPPAKFRNTPRYIGTKSSPLLVSVLSILPPLVQERVFDMKRCIICVLLGTVIGLIGFSSLRADPAPADAAGQAAKPMRVGTFDSRAVALAYYRKFYKSPEFTASLKKLKDDHDRAKAAGDEEKAKRLEAEGRAGQAHSHSQVFGSAPIDDVLAKIKDQLPNIAKQAGVDLIVSKWSVTYRSPDAQFVDVTEPMFKLFQPDESTLKILHEIPKHQPLSAEELKKHEKE
jgi:hypothetical protein